MNVKKDGERLVVKDFITTPPLRHRQSENMTRPPVPKPLATTTDSEVLRAYLGVWFATPLRNRCREYNKRGEPPVGELARGGVEGICPIL